MELHQWQWIWPKMPLTIICCFISGVLNNAEWDLMFQKLKKSCVFGAARWGTHPRVSTPASPRVCTCPDCSLGTFEHRDAPARCVRKPALAALCVLEKHKDAPHNCCLPCACFLYFSFVSWSRNHRLIPIKAYKRLPLLDQTQKNSSRWLKHIYIPQVITSWHSPLYSFPRVKAEILAHFYFFSLQYFFYFPGYLFFEETRKPKEWSPWVLTSAAVILTDSKET